LHKM